MAMVRSVGTVIVSIVGYYLGSGSYYLYCRLAGKRRNSRDITTSQSVCAALGVFIAVTIFNVLI